MAFSQNWHKLASVNGNTTAFSKDRYLIKGRDDSNIYNFSSNLLIHTIPEIWLLVKMNVKEVMCRTILRQ
jgi:hypothetical protein